VNLHLVGGFLGSGKTTAIINAAKMLMDQGRRVGVITNDQGKYLVDTAFFRLAAIPALEVTGGCFCCNYDDLNSRLAQIIQAAQPEVIFAESVGSCADIVATVVRPLLELAQGSARPTSFSVFSDARMLRRRLLGQELPFSEDVVYIFDKQIEEAGLLVVNKVDLLPGQADGQPAAEMRALLAERYPQKECLFQTSLTLAGVRPWLEQVESGRLELAAGALEMDYARYGAGEARLAWVDEEIVLRFPAGQGRAVLREFFSRVTGAIAASGAGIGHLKFILSGGPSGAKLSFAAIADPSEIERIPEIQGEEAALLVNARVEMPADALRDLLRQSLDEAGAGYTIKNEAAFHPPQPNPTYRLGGVSFLHHGGNDRLAAGDDQGVLELGGEAFIGGLQRPAVWAGVDAVRAGGDEGFDGQHHAFHEDAVVVGVVVIGDVVRVFMNATADAVPAQVMQGSEPAAFCFFFDHAANDVDRLPCLRRGDGALQRALGAVNEVMAAGIDRRNFHHHGGISEVAIQLGGNIQVDQVARFHHALAGDAMGGLIVDADAGGAGEVIDQLRGRVRPIAFEDCRANRVQLGGGDPRADLLAHFF
jgi:Ni2+-binding GTPase involved in maturation of urease and hydrogenase